jgi:hypothetical protein
VWSICICRSHAGTPEGGNDVMNDALKWIAITIISLTAMSLTFAGFALFLTGSTDSLADVGEMVSQIIIAIGKMTAEILSAATDF